METTQTVSGKSVSARRSREGKPVSLRDVAKLANVSVATVSMVINDNPRISRATHIKVQRLIDRLGYRPNRLAQSLSGRYTQVLALMLPALRHTFADAYFGELISGICDRAGKLGYKVMIEQAKPEFIKEKKHIDIFERRYVDGLICMGLNDRHHFLSDFSENKYPCVMADNYFPKWKLDHVVCDYRGGAEQAMSYLLQLGHKKIGLICAASEIQTCRDVMDVYMARLREAGQNVDGTWTEDGQFTESGGATATELLLARHPDITALLACNDKMAVGALHYLAGAGMKVPDDISVLGFDDLRHTAFITPALTTVHLPLYQVGANACERLVERIHGRSERVVETLPTHLVLRNSTAMAKNK
ncbi:MAG TPA: LacI family DNA-binding transcriptional regulator [Tepidisphaeraceae bacterium]|jgi:LacI family transcriptional regulator